MTFQDRLYPPRGLRVLVTAGASGIGAAIASAFAETGAEIHVCDIDDAALAAFQKCFPSCKATHADAPATTDVSLILRESAVVPDGICLDAEGAVWVADVVNQRLIRVAEGGAILDELRTDGPCAFACMLGGDDGRTLFACVAPTFDENEAAANHRSSILMTKVAV